MGKEGISYITNDECKDSALTPPPNMIPMIKYGIKDIEKNINSNVEEIIKIMNFVK